MLSKVKIITKKAKSFIALLCQYVITLTINKILYFIFYKLIFCLQIDNFVVLHYSIQNINLFAIIYALKSKI